MHIAEECGDVLGEHRYYILKLPAFIDPQREIVPRIAKMTRIDNEIFKGKPTIDAGIKELKKFVGNLLFV